MAEHRPLTKSRTRFARRSLLPRARRILAIGGLLLIAIVGAPGLFIASNCYGRNSATGSAPPAAVASDAAKSARDESSTYLTVPEWFIVYSSEEYAAFIAGQPPSRFPYWQAAAQYWDYYDAVCSMTAQKYPFNSGTHLMLGVIGVSFTIENALKGLYEKTAGRLTEWVAAPDTAEDKFAAATAAEYGKFLHTVPWYEFPFGAKLTALWRETPLRGEHVIRKWERRLALTAEYGIKALYGWVIRRSSQSVYGAEDSEIQARLKGAPEAVFGDGSVRRVSQVGSDEFMAMLPRYEAFTQTVLGLLARRVEFIEIAGNDEMVLTALAPRDLVPRLSNGQVITKAPILTQAGRQRIIVHAPVRSLHQVVAELQRDGASIEHFYDY